LQFTSSGHDIASDLLFGVRLGFTGTPNDFIPLSMVREAGVKYQMLEEKAIFMTLSNDDVVRTELYDQIISESVLSRLVWFASNQTFSALIDVGATITGLNNKQAAAALLILGLSRFEGVVYLDSDHKKRVLIRDKYASENMRVNKSSDGELPLLRRASSAVDGDVGILKRALSHRPDEGTHRFKTLEDLRDSEEFKALMQSKDVPLERCGIPKDKLFVLFDQTHSTGCHIDMAINAVGCITLSKDVTYRGAK